MESTPGQPEEEYHFSEHEGLEDFATAASPQPPPRPPRGDFKYKKIVLIAIAIVVLFAGYKLIDILLSGRTTPRQTAKVTPPVTTTVTTTQTTSPSSTEQFLQKQVVVEQKSAEQRLTALEQQNANNQAALDQLGKQIAELQNTLTTLDNRLVDLTSTVNGLNKVATKEIVAPEVAPLLKRRLTGRCCPGEGELIIKPKPIPVLYVKAMVQGRAWLLAENGHIITVAVGDQVPGYGIVRSIDTTQGNILMSSGAIIGYSPDDS